MFKTLICIGLGSFAGGITRFLVCTLVQKFISDFFALGTFLVNIIGCFAIGVIFGLIEKEYLISFNLKMFLIVGFCGGFTTFSSFINENYQLFDQKNFYFLLFYTAASLVGGFLLLFLGH